MMTDTFAVVNVEDERVYGVQRAFVLCVNIQ